MAKQTTFSEIDAVSDNEKHWQHEVGLLPYSTSILMTKESLIAFLKTAGVEVDLNGAELKKLPKFAKFGKISDKPASVIPQAAPVDSPAQMPTPAASNEPSPAIAQKPRGGDVYAADFVPTRKGSSLVIRADALSP